MKTFVRSDLVGELLGVFLHLETHRAQRRQFDASGRHLGLPLTPVAAGRGPLWVNSTIRRDPAIYGRSSRARESAM